MAIFLLLAIILSGSPLLRATDEKSEGLVLIDWSHQPVGESVQKPFPDDYFDARDGAEPKITDEKSQPPSPFGKQPALYIGSAQEVGEHPSLMLTTNPYMGTRSPQKGWGAIPFQIEEGMMTVEWGVNDATDSPAQAASSGNTNDRIILIKAYIQPDRKILFQYQNEDGSLQSYFGNIPTESNRPYVLKMEWSFQNAEVEMRFYLDGELLISDKGEDAITRKWERSDFSINRLGFSLPSGSFLGNITIASPE